MKQKNRQPIHVRIDRWIRREMERILEDNEEIVDVSFRVHPGPSVPSGWSVVLVKTVLGEKHLHGINFPIVGKPTKRDIDAVVEKARAILDKAISKRSLVVTPEQARDISMIRGGVKSGPVRS